MKNKVHLIDCKEFMKDKTDKYYDLAIVDPPYGIGDVRNTKSKKLHKEILWNDNIPNKKYFKELYRISKNQIIWGSNYYQENIKDVGRLIYDKTAKCKTHLKEMSDADIASHSFGVNIKIFRYEWRGNVQGNTINWKNEGIDARIHPTQKPIALYKWLLQNYAKPGQTIFDSHVGSGSIRIACHDMGFDFEGCELDPDYWQAQEDRYQNHIAQGELFDTQEYQERIYE